MRRAEATLTTEEREVLILSARLLTNEEIAEHLGMSVINVKSLIHRASVKMGAHSRIGAIHCAFKQWYIKIDEVYTPNELIEWLDGLAPDVLSKIAQVVCQRAKCEIPPMIDEGIPYTYIEQDTILTKGEQDVLILVWRGLTNREMAENLCISVGAVRKMLINVYCKLGVCSRGDAFLSALKQRALSLNEVISVDEIEGYLAQLKPESLQQMAQLLRMKLEQKRHHNSWITGPPLAPDSPSPTNPNLCFAQAS